MEKALKDFWDEENFLKEVQYLIKSYLLWQSSLFSPRCIYIVPVEINLH